MCNCGITEFCLLCPSTEHRTEPDYSSKIRLVINVEEIHGEETISFEYKYMCDKHRIKEDECILTSERLMTEEEKKNSHTWGNAKLELYSIHNKNEMLNLFAIPKNLIKLEYCYDIDHNTEEDVYISKGNYNKIKAMSEQNTQIIKEEQYKRTPE